MWMRMVEKTVILSLGPKLLQDPIHKAEEIDSEDLLRLSEATALVTTDEFIRICATYV